MYLNFFSNPYTILLSRYIKLYVRILYFLISMIVRLNSITIIQGLRSKESYFKY